MKNRLGYEIGPNSPRQRFIRLWDIARTGTVEEVGSMPSDTGAIRTGKYVDTAGVERDAILRTLDVPYVTGSLRPHVRVVEALLDDNTALSLNDFSVVGQPGEPVLAALTQLEQILPTFE